MALLNQSGSDYQLAEITLDAGNARDITCMLVDVHAVLDHLYLDGTQPAITAPAGEYLRESDSPYTLPGLIGALDEVITQLTCQMRHAINGDSSGGRAHHVTSPHRPAPDTGYHAGQGWGQFKEEPHRRDAQGRGQIRGENWGQFGLTQPGLSPGSATPRSARSSG